VKKGAVVVLAMALLMTFAAVPVMAEPTKGNKVEAFSWIVPSDTIYADPGVARFNENLFEKDMYKVVTYHIKGWTEIYPTAGLVIGSNYYPVYSVNFIDMNMNFKTGVVVFQIDVVWYIPADGSPNGFAGNFEMKGYGYDVLTDTYDHFELHGVLQGFGSFAEQILYLTTDLATGMLTGYCLIK